MLLTIILSVIVMAGLFLMLIAGVAFIQDKKYFTSAPKDVQDAILPREERFKGAHILGWILMVISLVMMLGALVYGAVNGVQNGYGFIQLFVRFVVILWLLKAFDILFFDWFLLCHSNFYPHFYPETKEYVGPHQFGFNKKEHIIHIIACPVVAAVIAFICTLF